MKVTRIKPEKIDDSYIEELNKLKKMTYLNNQIKPQHTEKYFIPFIYPSSCYCGEPTPENVEFNISIQKLSEEIGYIAGLEASGQITTKQAYNKVKALTRCFLKTYGDNSSKNEVRSLIAS